MAPESRLARASACQATPAAAYACTVRSAAISGSTGAVTATLHKRGHRILLELDERRPDGCRVVVVTTFSDSTSFESWCANDPLRFEQPIVHRELRRKAEELWRLGS